MGGEEGLFALFRHRLVKKVLIVFLRGEKEGRVTWVYKKLTNSSHSYKKYRYIDRER